MSMPNQTDITDKEIDLTPYPVEYRIAILEWLENGLCLKSALVMVGLKKGMDTSVGAAMQPLLWEERHNISTR